MRRLMVELIHDGMNQPVAVPVIVLRGRREGPVFGMCSALHGNELNGIRVIHKLLDAVELHQLQGTLVAVLVGNVPGYMMRQREFSDGKDLNHLMPGRPHGATSQVWAYNLLGKIISKFDYFVDMHTASFGRINSLYIRADMSDALCARMTYLQRPQIILHNPAHDKTLRGAAMELGIPSVTIEIGNPHRFQPEFIKRALTGVRAVLGDLGMLPRRKISAGPEPIICDASRWLYTSGGGLLEVFPDVTQEVAEGELIARRRNIFGDVIHEYTAPEAGVVIGKSVDPVAETGARILHLGTIADQSDAAFLSREHLRSLKLPNLERESWAEQV